MMHDSVVSDMTLQKVGGGGCGETRVMSHRLNYRSILQKRPYELTIFCKMHDSVVSDMTLQKVGGGGSGETSVSISCKPESCLS